MYFLQVLTSSECHFFFLCCRSHFRIKALLDGCGAVRSSSDETWLEKLPDSSLVLYMELLRSCYVKGRLNSLSDQLVVR